MAAFKGIQQSPRVSHRLGLTHCAHHTHTKDVPPPFPVQRQAIGGFWVGPQLTPTPKLKLFTSHGCLFQCLIWLGCTSNCVANSLIVLSPFNAANAALGLNAGLWFRLGRLAMLAASSPHAAGSGAENPPSQLFRFLGPPLLCSGSNRSRPKKHSARAFDWRKFAPHLRKPQPAVVPRSLSARSIPGVDIRSKGLLRYHRCTNLKIAQLNVTTPSRW